MENNLHPLFAEKIDYDENAYLFERIEDFRNGTITRTECADIVAPLILERQNRVAALNDLSDYLQNEARGLSASVDLAFIRIKQALQKDGLSSLKGDVSEIFPNGIITASAPAPAVDPSIDEVGKAIVIRQGQIAKIKEQIERLRGQIAEIEDANDADRKKLLDDLIFAGEKKRTGKVFGARISNTKAVVVKDEDAIPSEYLATTTRPMLAEIKRALQDGKEVNGCELEERQHVTITK